MQSEYPKSSGAYAETQVNKAVVQSVAVTRELLFRFRFYLTPGAARITATADARRAWSTVEHRPYPPVPISEPERIVSPAGTDHLSPCCTAGISGSEQVAAQCRRQ